MIKIENLNVSFDHQHILKDVSLHLKKHHILAIVGQSGSGKTTLLKTILKLIPQDSGRILFNGQPVSTTHRGKHIGIVFQDTMKSLLPITSIQNQLIEFVQTHTNQSKQQIIQEAIELLEMMNVEDPKRVLKSYPHELSGGLIQRVGIMFSMILKPEVVLLDEPTSALDVVSQYSVLQEIKKLNESFHTSFIIVTHHLGVVDYLCDDVVVLNEGKVVESGTKEDLFNNPQTTYLKQLLQARMKVEKCSD